MVPLKTTSTPTKTRTLGGSTFLFRLAGCGILFSLLCSVNAVEHGERFDEEVIIRRFQSHAFKDAKTRQSPIYTTAHFSFRMISQHGGAEDDRIDSSDHYNLFPKSVGQVMTLFGVEEVDVSFATTMWQSEQYGPSLEGLSAIDDTPFVVPPGVQIQGTLLPLRNASDEGTSTKLQAPTPAQRWTKLVRHLAGLLCASLNQLSGTKSIVIGSHTFRGQLPNEPVCTENLTPFLKLLPSRQHEGLAKLFKPTILYSSAYHAMRIQYKLTCLSYRGETCAQRRATLTQSITTVFDEAVANLFDVQLPGQAPSKRTLQERENFQLDNSRVATSSTLKIVNRKGSKEAHEPATRDYEVAQIMQGSDVAVEVWDLLFRESSIILHPEETKMESEVEVRKVSTQSDLVQGKMKLFITNKGNQVFRAVLTDIIPSFVRVYPSSIKVKTAGLRAGIEPLEYSLVPTVIEHGARKIEDDILLGSVLRFRLPRMDDPEANGFLMASVLVEAEQVVLVEYMFKKKFQHIDDFPPDPSRGLDIPVASVHLQGIDVGRVEERSEGQRGVVLYSNQVVIRFPQPDYSMPFNVVTLSSTIIAFFFGTLLNIYTKRPVKEPWKRKPLLQRLKTKLSELKEKAFGKNRKMKTE